MLFLTSGVGPYDNFVSKIISVSIKYTQIDREGVVSLSVFNTSTLDIFQNSFGQKVITIIVWALLVTTYIYI